MTTYELLDYLRELLDILRPDSELEKLLETISKNFDEAVTWVSGVAAAPDANNAWTSAQNLKGQIQAAIQQTKTVGPGYTYIQLSDWMRRLERLQSTSLENSQLREAINVLLNAGRRFFDQYDNFVKDSSAAETLKLLSGARSLHGIITFTREFVQGLLDLAPAPQAGAGELEFSLFLSITGDLRDVKAKLDAIQTIYEELAHLMDVSTSKYPLRVIKIESGTLWTKLFGESRVVTLLVSLVEKSISYMYRNYTPEGGVVSLPKTVEAVEAVLKLREELDKAGIDTSSMKANLEKSGIVISQKLNDLLLGQPRVDVNGRAHSVGEEFHARFLKESRMLFLGAGNQQDSNGEDGASDTGGTADQPKNNADESTSTSQE